MATNNILPFCPTDTGSNLLSQADYAAASDRTNGNQPGVASSKLVNKAIRQSAFISSQFAQYISDKTGLNVLDDGNTGNLYTVISAAMADVRPIRSVTVTDTATNLDSTLVLSGASFTETLPNAAAVPGKVYNLIHNGTSLTQVYTIATGGGTIGGIASGSYALYTNTETLTVQSDGTNYIILDHKTQTPWVNSGVNTVTGSTTNPTKGTTSVDKLWLRRNGSQLEGRMEFGTGVGSAGSGDYLFALPANYPIDTTLLTANNTVIGAPNDPSALAVVGDCIAAGPSFTGVGSFYVATGTQIKMYVLAPATRGVVGSGLLGFSGAVYYMGNFSVPITGWRP